MPSCRPHDEKRWSRLLQAWQQRGNPTPQNVSRCVKEITVGNGHIQIRLLNRINLPLFQLDSMARRLSSIRGYHSRPQEEKHRRQLWRTFP